MPSFKCQIVNGQCIINVRIQSVDVSETTVRIPPKNTFKALIDTGAQKTCISRSIVDTLGLVSSGKALIQSATQVTSVKRYEVHLIIPTEKITIISKNQIRLTPHAEPFMNHPVNEMPAELPNFQVLLGMDILKDCNLIIAHGEFILSY